MKVFEVVIALLLGGAILAAFARRIRAPYPALVALAGAALALVPGMPTIALDPELALALFVAPVLVDAAFDASERDLRDSWRPVISLAFGAVVLTVGTVAVVARILVPEMPWAVAVALGAIVAPPDAAAATTVLKQLRPPHRLLVILEGESLFNDATALLIYRFAVGATLTGFVAGWTIVPTIVLVTAGSFVLGIVLSRISLAINERISDVATAVIFQFCSTFAVWMLAEQLRLSGIITLVAYAMTASRRAPEILSARIRVPAWAVWEVAVFVLNVLAFVIVGLQLKSISERVTGTVGAHYAFVAAMVCLAVIMTRIIWVAGAFALTRVRARRASDPIPGSGRGAAVVAWCGMRGTVTLAAALALPGALHGGEPFPYRDLILVTAFGVVLGTLVLQGLTLRPLMLRLRLEDDGAVDREIHFARVETLRAAVAAAADCPDAETAELVRHRYELQLRRAEHESTDAEMAAAGARADARVVRAATHAARQRLVQLRSERRIGDAAFQRVEEELDWAELDWAQFLHAGDTADATPKNVKLAGESGRTSDS